MAAMFLNNQNLSSPLENIFVNNIAYILHKEL